MKKVIFAIAGLFIFCIAASAQQQGEKEPKTPEERAAHRAQRLSKDLSLSDDQTSKVKNIFLQHEQQAKTIKDKYANATDKKPMHAEMKTLRSNTDSQLKQVLTPDQYTKYEAQKEEHKDHKQNGGGQKHHNH